MDRLATSEFGYRLASVSLLVLWASLTFSPALVEISSVVAIFGWAMAKAAKGDWRWHLPDDLVGLLAAYVLVCAASVVFSDYVPTAVRGMVKVFQQLAVFVVAAEILASDKNLKWFFNCFLTVATLVTLNGIFQYVMGYDLIRGFAFEPASAGVRITASFGTYGKLATYLLITIPVLVALTVAKRMSGRKGGSYYLSLVLIGASLLLLFWTRSRGAFLALAGGVFLLLLALRKWQWLLAVVLAATVCLLLLPRSMLIHLDAEGKEQSLVERYYLWRRALDVIAAKPLLGTGINTYAVAHEKYDRLKNWRVRHYYAHNGYLQMAAEIGIPGLVIFLAFLWRLIRRLWVPEPQRAGPYAVLLQGVKTGILTFLIFAGVDTVLHNPQPVLTFWYVAGLAVAMLKVYEDTGNLSLLS